MQQLKAIAKLEKEKKRRQKYDADSVSLPAEALCSNYVHSANGNCVFGQAAHVLIVLLGNLHQMTGDDRFKQALLHILRDA